MRRTRHMWGRSRAGHGAARVVTHVRIATLVAIGAIGAAPCRARDSGADTASVGASPPPAAATATASDSAREHASGGDVAQGRAAWHFDSAAGQPPAGFSFGRTGSGRPGQWVIRAAPDAPSGPNVLAQEDTDRTDYRFPVAVADAPSYGDVRVSVRCKPVSGRVDQACGIVWRYRDENNYYVARANALEGNVRFYYVENGRRREVKGWDGAVRGGAWHELRADMRGDHVEVYFDGTKVIDARDARFATPGKVGVWTKADSRTLFDDLTATPLGS
jgi:hypothetical protein